MGRREKEVPSQNTEALPIGARMRLARQQKALSLSKMAEDLRYSTSFLSTVENGVALPPRDLVEKYERRLDSVPGTLLTIFDRDVRTKGSIKTSHSENTSGQVKRRRGSFKEDWGEIPVVSHFYGRESERKDLKRLLAVDKCQIVAILGLGGIGKTTLAAIVAEQAKNEFHYIFWRSLQNAPPLTNILTSCIQFVSANEQENIPPHLDDQIRLLIANLRKHRCLIVLDNLEAVLGSEERTDQYLENHAGYGTLLQRIGEVKHQSCILLTSREKPKEIAFLEAKTMPVRSIQLSGLGQVEAKKILQEKELIGEDDEWKQLIDLYAGNPLALKLVSEFIREVFDRSIADFLKAGEPFFGSVHDLLDQQFARLSRLESEIMYWLAIGQEAVALDELQQDLAESVLRRELLKAIDSLQRRFMIEKKGSGRFIVQPVIMEYVTSRLVEQAQKEISTGEFELLDRVALIKAQTKEYIRESQVRSILNPVVDGLRNMLGKDGCEVKIKSLLSTLRKTQSPPAGYRSGNLLNFLIQLKADLRGSDFSHLTILQAYLQGVDLPEVNFAHANFAKTVFTDTFGSILSVAVDINGEILAAGTANGMIRLWAVSDSEPLYTCQEHKDWVRAVAFSPDGAILASGSDDCTIRLWDTGSGECLRVLQGHEHRVRSVAFSPDGAILASGSDDCTIRLWDTGGGECLRVLQGHEHRVRSVAFSPDGAILASGSDDCTIRLWDTGGGECLRVLQGHKHRVRSVAFSPDGAILASGSDDCTIRLWDTGGGNCLRILYGHTQLVRSVAFSPDGAILASGSEDQTIRFWDVKTGECNQILHEHSNAVRSVAFTPDGHQIVSGSDDQTIRSWDAKTGQCLKTLQGYSSCIYSVAFSPDGMLLASGNHDHKVRVWDVSSKTYKTLNEHHGLVYSVSFNPTGNLLASGSHDHTVCIWDVETGRCLRTLRGHSNQINSVAFSPDGMLLASGSEDNTVCLWEVSTGKVLNVLVGHSNRVRSVVFSPDGTLLATGSEDTTIRLWEIHARQPLRILSGHRDQVRSVAFSPDGMLLASGSEDKTVCLWEVNTGRHFAPLKEHTDRVRTVAFSPDGTLLASGSDDTTIRLWDVSNRLPLGTLQGHRGLIYSLEFKQDNRTIASGSYDGTIKIWDLQTERCLQTLYNERPYEHMNIQGVSGLTAHQKDMLRELGATEA
jgi:WD40 repeat protein/transcriptional regulator with XRE-family HTH domain